MTTQRTFEAVAAAVRAGRLVATADLDTGSEALGGANLATRVIAGKLADVFAADNPRFNRRLFLSACGLGE